MTVKQVFDDEELTDASEVDSDLFYIAQSGGRTPSIAIMIACDQDSGGNDNIVVVKLMVSPDYGDVVDKDDAHWFRVSEDAFKSVHCLIGANYDIGAPDSGDEFLVEIPVPFTGDYCKLVAQRQQVSGAGANTATVNAWVTY